MKDVWTRFLAALFVGLAVAASSAMAQRPDDDPQPTDEAPADEPQEDDAQADDEQPQDEPPADEPADADDPLGSEDEPAPPSDQDEPEEPADDPLADEPPVDEPADQPADLPSDEPADLPSDLPSDEPADRPQDAPADEPADRPSDRGDQEIDAQVEGDLRGDVDVNRQDRGRQRGRAREQRASDLGLTFATDQDRLVIESVEDRGALAAAGLQQGDVLLSVDDRRISSQRDFFRWIQLARPGSRIALNVLRDGQRETVYIRQADLFPRGYREQYRVQYEDPGPRATLGVVLDGRFDRGARVRRVVPDSAAEQAGIRPGDIIVRLAGQRVGSPDELIQLVARHEPGEVIDIQVVRPVQARLDAAAGYAEGRREERLYSEEQYLEGEEDIRIQTDGQRRGRVRIGSDRDFDEGIRDRDRDGRRLEILRPRD